MLVSMVLTELVLLWNKSVEVSSVSEVGPMLVCTPDRGELVNVVLGRAELG